MRSIQTVLEMENLLLLCDPGLELIHDLGVTIFRSLNRSTLRRKLGLQFRMLLPQIWYRLR
jgi:hypothetical protein